MNTQEGSQLDPNQAQQTDSQSPPLTEILGQLSARLGRTRSSHSQELDLLINTCLLPRLSHPAALPTVVIVGATGTGKSTLYNSLAGRVLTTAGVIRPTSHQISIWHHPHQQYWTGYAPVTSQWHTYAHPLTQALTLVDTPDLDSDDSQHRLMTSQMARQAELMVWVTTPGRYADQVPWDFLLEQVSYGKTLMVVVNRGRRSDLGAARSDLGRMLTRRGLRPTQPPLLINEQRLTDGMLPAAAVASLCKQLLDVAVDSHTLVNKAGRGSWQRMLDLLLLSLLSQPSPPLNQIYSQLRSLPFPTFGLVEKMA